MAESSCPAPTRRELALCLVLLALLTAAGAYIRAITLDVWPLSFDEVSTIRGTHAGPVDMARWLHHYEHPPLSYALVQVSRGLFGSSEEWVLRLPSLACGVLCIPALFLLGRTIHSNRLGLLMAALGTFDPILISQARQARMYSVLALTTILLVAATTHLTKRRIASPWAWMAWGVLFAACFWSHALGLVVWAATLAGFAAWAIWLAARREPVPWRMLSGAGVGVAFAVAISHVGLLMIASRVAWAVRSATRGVEATQATGETLAAVAGVFASPVAGAVLLLLSVAGVAMLVRRHPPIGVLTIVLAIAGVAAVAAARTDHHTMDPRYFVLLSLALIVGAGCVAAMSSHTAARAVATVGVAVVCIIGAWHAVRPEMAYYHRVATVARMASELGGPGDTVYFYHPISARLTEYYPLRAEAGVPSDAGADYPRTLDEARLPDRGERALVVVNYLTEAERPQLAQLVDRLAERQGMELDERQVVELTEREQAVLLEVSPKGVAWRAEEGEEWNRLETAHSDAVAAMAVPPKAER